MRAVFSCLQNTFFFFEKEGWYNKYFVSMHIVPTDQSILKMDAACLPIENMHHSNEFESIVFEDRWQRCIVAGVAATICIGGILGNSMTILSVILSKKLKSFTYAFVANLAVADLLSSILIAFYVENLLWTDETRLPLPCTLCKAIGVLTFVAFSCAVVNIALISFNRYYRITKPLDKYIRLFNKNRFVLMMAIPWFYSLLTPVLGESLGFTTFGYNHKYRICLIHFMDQHVGSLTFVRIFLIDIIGIFVMIFCYLSIFCHMRRQNARLLKLFPTNSISAKVGENNQEKLGPVTVRQSESDERIETKDISVTEEKEKHRECIDGVIKEYATVTMEITETYKLRKTLATVISVEDDTNRKSLQLEDMSSLSSAPTGNGNTADGVVIATEPVQGDCKVYSSDSESTDCRRDGREGTFVSQNEEEGSAEEGTGKDHVSSKRYKKRTTNRGRMIIRITVSKRQTALTKNLALVGCTFLACTIPYVACVGIEPLANYLPYVTLLYASKACINPLIYAFKDPRFRKAYYHILRLQFKKVM